MPEAVSNGNQGGRKANGHRDFWKELKFCRKMPISGLVPGRLGCFVGLNSAVALANRDVTMRRMCFLQGKAAFFFLPVLLTVASCTKNRVKQHVPAPEQGAEGADSSAPAPGELTAPGQTGSGGPGSAAIPAIPQRRGPYAPVPPGYNLAMVQQMAAAHKAARGVGFQYVYLTPTAAQDREMANTIRVAIGKAWNHLSWQPELDIPEDVSNGAGLVFALNAQKIWGANAATNWNYLANCSPKSNISVSPAPRGDCARFDAAQPIAAERFAFNATNGGPYANVHKTPPFFGSFRQKYRMGPIFATSTQKEAIVCGPRIIAYRVVFPDLPRGATLPPYSNMQEALELVRQGKGLLYSYTTDEFDGRDGGSIRYTRAPTDKDQRSTGSLRASPNDDGTAVASEWWIQLPNGFMYYSIHGEGSQERGKAEFPFATDPANWKQDADLTTGRSCITCHIKGTQAAPSDVEFEGKNGWTANSDLKILNDFSVQKFSDPLVKLTQALSDDESGLNDKIISGTIEPVKRAIMVVEGAYRGRDNGSCVAFCDGKFSSRRRNLCETMPAK